MNRPWGLLAEFDDSDRLIEAVRRTREAGYTEFEAHTPFPVEGLADALDFQENKIDPLHLAGGIVVGGAALLLQWWINVVDYPLNIGGRPLAAWPAFVLPTFEIATVGATVVGVAAMLYLNGLPGRKTHPLLKMERFHLASDSRFFLSIQASDPVYEPRRTRAFLEGLGPVALDEVPR
ncbi:DUF3341 domain-containing protein [Telmatospirillum sp. J64-1]|uniref:DUF3341 domain-containing protein n=1 Tax=Telmatospirillum sp. J64-1 TaxID=2502183 RepID=UPI00115E4DC6|nr:DUF3341 domain-containing protein [Telmatospirillum sp. J64-1]